MHIPKRLKIRKAIWKVTLTPGHKKLNTELYRGMCYLDTHQIFVDSKLTRNELEETFVHELLHASFPSNVCSDKLEEKIVEKLSRVLYQALSTNKMLVPRKRKKTKA